MAVADPFVANTTCAEMFLAFHVQWALDAQEWLRKASRESTPAVRAVMLEGARVSGRRAREQWAKFLKHKNLRKAA